MMSKLSEEQIETIWETVIKDRVFGNQQQDDQPITVFLGGQPGAGKTLGASIAQQLDHDYSLVPIVGDDYRQFYPGYLNLVRHDPLRMPKVTGHASGRWIALSVDYANMQNYSISIEGTWRHASTVLDRAKKAKELGRATHALLIATQPIVSRTRALARYVDDATQFNKARWTPPTAENIIFDNLSESVKEISLSSLIDRFTVVSNGQIIFDAFTRDRSQAWRAWASEYSRPLTFDQRKEICSTLNNIEEEIPLLEQHISGQADRIQQEISEIREKILVI